MVTTIAIVFREKGRGGGEGIRVSLPNFCVCLLPEIIHLMPSHRFSFRNLSNIAVYFRWGFGRHQRIDHFLHNRRQFNVFIRYMPLVMDRDGQRSILYARSHIELALARKSRHAAAIPLLLFLHRRPIAFRMHQILAAAVLVCETLEVRSCVSEAKPSVLANDYI